MAYSPADADTSTTIHDVDLSAGANAVTVTVTAEDGSTEDYTVSVNRGVTDAYGWKAVDDLDGLIAAGNTSPYGIWSDGATMWVADSSDGKLYAYNPNTKAPDASQDFTTLSGAENRSPNGIWSDGATMWVTDGFDRKIYAYRMSDQTRDTSKEFNTLNGAANDSPAGIWSDGTTMWVADSFDGKIYAYRMSDQTRDTSKDFNTLSVAGNDNPSGIWSDGTTMWVADRGNGKIYAYRMSNKARNASKEFTTLSGAGNNDPFGIWSDGDTMWVADWVDDKVYSYNMPPSSDATLRSLTVSPQDIIGFAPDRTTYEVGVEATITRATITATASDSNASVAYSPADADTSTTIHDVDLSTGANAVTITVTSQDGSATETYTVSVNRGVADDYGWKAVDDLDGLIAAGNTSPYGIWSDGATMWVADSSDGKLYAYNPNTKAPDASQDFTTLSGAENRSPNGIWSDGATMWVTDGFDRKIYAYRMSDQTRDTSKEFNTLNGAANDSPAGIWSDGTTMWVADSFDGKIYAYRMSDQTHDTSKDFNTLGSAGNDNPSGIWSDGTTMWVADRGNGKIYAYRMSNKAPDASGKDFTTLSGAGNNDPFGIWSDGDTMWVADWVDDKVYSYNMPPSSDATLRSLTVSPQDIIGFAPDRTSYEVGVASTETRATITATANHSAASVTYSPADADASTTIHDLDLSAGRNAVTVTVTSQDGSATRDYTVSVNRGVADDYGWKASDDLDGLIAAGNNPIGIWSNGVTTWVADFIDDKLYAYNTDGTRDASQDFDTLSGAGNRDPSGIWSDGKTMWVTDSIDGKIYAYNTDGTRDSDEDFTTLRDAGNRDPYGIWSDGATMWVTDGFDRKIYAYRMSDQTRDTSKEFNTLSVAGNGDPTGIWSDDNTMWVADWVDDKIYAYQMSDKTRDSGKDFTTLSGASNNYPTGIWSDGDTMWVADWVDDKVYSYNSPSSDATLSALTLVTNLGNTGQDSMVVRPDKPYATTFVTAPGARIIYKLSGVEMRAAKEVGSYDSPVPQVSLYRDAGGRPGSQLYTLTGPDDFLSEDDTEFRTYTFTAPQGASLDAGVAYWVVFAGASGSTHYRVDSTTETAQTGDGWSIGDISMDRESGGWLPTTIGPAKFAVLGAEIDLQETATTLVTNLDPAGTEALTVSGAERRATSFTTAAAGPWVRYEFSGIQIRTQRGVASLRPTPLVTVHRDVGGRPAAAPLFTLDPPGDFLSTVDTDFHVNTFTAPSGAFLDPGATYWVVFAVESINYQVQATDDTTQTGDGWMIGDVYSFFVSGNWHTGSTGPAQFAVLGTGVGLLDEDPDVDLPGGAHDCQLTDGVVVVGHTSSGHLTAGVDTSSGLTGDCFRLETQWGKQYRVEVKFGDTESVDIGGSAWIVYTGSDFSGMSSLGSAVDHNREDGRSFTDFKHIHNKVKSYFVDVAAYDLYSTPYSTNSLTYNGPYTITMKDITGVQRMVTNIDPTLGSPVDYETGLSLSDGGTITLAAPFITGDHPEGYALDRIRVPFDDIADEGASPLISIYSNSSDTPSAKLCDLDRPAQIVESAVTWSGNPPPFTFLADDCAYNTLAASTPYWVVFTGVDPADYTLEMTNSAEEHDYYGTGWTMDNFLARSTDGGASWTVTAANAGNIRIEFWAKPKTNSATGEPLARGQRFLPGQELTAGPGTVSDPDGTSRANYRYQWRRTDDQGVSTVIEGATGASYIITDDDRGHRVWVIVFFLDDAGNEESRASMATSYVPGQTRILIKKSGGTNNRAHGTVGLSSGFYTAAGDLKHRIESVTQILTAAGIGNINTDLFRFRLFTSNDASNPLDRKPAVEIATFTNPARVATGQKKFTAPTDALLAGGTTYHIVMYTGGAGEIGCEQLGSSQAHDGSLPNWELIQRTYPLTSENTAGSAYFGDPCNMRIDGYQLADAPHITSLEITSTPNTSPSYETGETISVTATLSEAVNFTGPEPVLPIRIGDNTREAIYDAGSSTTTQWVFQYIVLEEDRDDDGISVEQHALRAYADADLSHNAISTAPSHRVNARSLLRSVRVTSKPEAPNWYGPGETIQFTAEFTLPVTVTGDPEFAFSITSGGSTHARATYIGTTENRIVFEYTISTTDDDSNGIWIGDHTDTLRLDGDDAIVGVSNGRTAVLDHPEIGRLASHRIDQNPRIVTVAVTSDPTHGTNSDIYAPGEVIEFTATFNQEVNVVGDPEFEFSIDSGSADERAAYHSGSGTKAIVFRYTIVAADIDPSGIWIGDQTRTFKLDADDSIRGVSNSLDAVLDHRGLGILTGHKIDNMITP